MKINVYTRIRTIDNNKKDIFDAKIKFHKKGNTELEKKDGNNVITAKIDGVFTGDNTDKQRMLEEITPKENHKPQLFLFLGNSGSGKTYTFQQLLDHFLNNNYSMQYSEFFLFYRPTDEKEENLEFEYYDKLPFYKYVDYEGDNNQRKVKMQENMKSMQMETAMNKDSTRRQHLLYLEQITGDEIYRIYMLDICGFETHKKDLPTDFSDEQKISYAYSKIVTKYINNDYNKLYNFLTSEVEIRTIDEKLAEKIGEKVNNDRNKEIYYSVFEHYMQEILLKYIDKNDFKVHMFDQETGNELNVDTNTKKLKILNSFSSYKYKINNIELIDFIKIIQIIVRIFGFWVIHEDITYLKLKRGNESKMIKMDTQVLVKPIELLLFSTQDNNKDFFHYNNIWVNNTKNNNNPQTSCFFEKYIHAFPDVKNIKSILLNGKYIDNIDDYMKYIEKDKYCQSKERIERYATMPIDTRDYLDWYINIVSKLGDDSNALIPYLIGGDQRNGDALYRFLNNFREQNEEEASVNIIFTFVENEYKMPELNTLNERNFSILSSLKQTFQEERMSKQSKEFIQELFGALNISYDPERNTSKKDYFNYVKNKLENQSSNNSDKIIKSFFEFKKL